MRDILLAMGWMSFDEGTTRKLAPGFELILPDGRPISHNRYRYRNNLVLAFIEKNGTFSESRVRTWFRRAAADHSEFAEEQARLLVVVGGPREALAPFLELPGLEVAADVSRRLKDQFAGYLEVKDFGPMSIYILDRYGAPFAAWTGSAGGSEPAVAEILDWLKFIELQCPE